MSFSAGRGYGGRLWGTGDGLWVTRGGKTNAAEQITAARMPQKGTTLRGKMNAEGNTRRFIGEH